MCLNDVIVVLCRVHDSGNIGATCRALKNSGLSRLRTVKVGAVDETVIQSRAVHAFEVWSSCQHFDSLSAAISDCSLVVGTTRRQGLKRKSLSLQPEEVAQLFLKHPGPAALVFGNERTGLEDSEIIHCTVASHIPAFEAFPSLNLSHAIQIYAYQLFRTLEVPDLQRGHWVPLNNLELESMVKRITDLLALLGFYTRSNREEQERFFHDIFARAGISLREGEYLERIVSRAVYLGLKKH
ncbi:putative tRNA/rRNA methyltransferase [Pillotina sp. SPG140]|jgi:tRNA/rRNA methyltransferase/tRNA (cytidine32/uridine32-2'-O)-methyltransferase